MVFKKSYINIKGIQCVCESKNGFRGELTTVVILLIWHPYDMKPNTYHSLHKIEHVSVSSTFAQTKCHGRVRVNIRLRTKLTLIYWLVANKSKIANKL